MTFGEKVRMYRKQLKLKQSDLGKVLGVGKTTISEWESGNRSPDIDRLDEIALALKVLAVDLLDVDSPTNTKNSESWHRPLVTAYKTADVPVRRSACRVLDIDYVDPDQPGIPDNVVRLQDALDGSREMPIKTLPAAGGAGIYVEDEAELRTFPLDLVPDSADCGVLISGNSMEPDIMDGDIVWVHETPIIHNHQVGVFIINRDEAVCKRAKFDDRGRLVWLMSDNPKEPDIRVRDLEECRVFGRVVGVYHEK